MKEHAIRLTRGQDLKREIEKYCQNHDTMIVLSSVGCLYKLHIRLAGANDELLKEDDFEICALNGTVSHGECHLHIVVSDKNGNCFGGHLKEGCLINTTCELVMGELEEYRSKREADIATGYNEIIFRRI